MVLLPTGRVPHPPRGPTLGRSPCRLVAHAHSPWGARRSSWRTSTDYASARGRKTSQGSSVLLSPPAPAPGRAEFLAGDARRSSTSTAPLSVRQALPLSTHRHSPHSHANKQEHTVPVVADWSAPLARNPIKYHLPLWYTIVQSMVVVQRIWTTGIEIPNTST